MSNVRNVPLKGSAPAGSPGSYTSKDQIVALLKGTNPGAVSSAGKAYVDFAGTYEQMVANLKGFSNELAEAWTGPASNAAQAQLLDMHESALQIFQQSDSAGRVVQAHGDSYLSWYHSSMPTPKTTQEAQQWMQAANGRITQTWQAMPDSLSTKLPPTKSGDINKWTPPPGSSGGGQGSGGGTGAVHGGGGSGQHSPSPTGTAGGRSSHPSGTGGQHFAGNGSGNGATTPHAGSNDPSKQWWPDGSNGNHRTDLSSFDPAANGMNGSGPGSSGGGPSGGGSAGVGGPPGSLPFGGGGGSGAGGGLGPSGIGLVPGGPGMGSGPGNRAGGGVLGSGNSSSASAGRSGAPGLPGASGHGSGEDKTRERNRGAWLAEERSLWDGDVESVPGIIGEAPPKAAVSQETEESAEEEAAGSDTAALLQAALARIIELEARNGQQPPLSEPPI